MLHPSEIVERFARIHRDSPDRPLVHLPLTATTLTVADVQAASIAQRRALDEAGLGPDTLVLLTIGNRPAVFPFWLACRAAGVPVMPTDADATAAEIGGLAKRFGAALAIMPADSALAGEIGAPEPFSAGLVAVRIAGVEPRPEICRGAAALKLTSGSTGLPKATFTTERELVVDTDHILEAMDIRPEHTQIAAIPLSHAYGLSNLLMPALLQGTAVVLHEGFAPHALAADAHDRGADVFQGVPFMFEHFTRAAPPGGWPPRLGKLMSAGARLETGTVSHFAAAYGVKIHSFYGTTETGGIAYDDGEELTEEAAFGRLLAQVEVTLKVEDGIPTGLGRVHVAGPAVAAGYAGDAGADGSFVDGGFLTGDLGRIDKLGRLVLSGRLSHFINVAGRKVQPEEVEQVLRTMPSVADVRVVGAPDASRGQQIVACIVADGGPGNVLAVRQYCAARLAPHKLPRLIVWLDRIPLTVRGKTDRARLDALVHAELCKAAETGML